MRSCRTSSFWGARRPQGVAVAIGMGLTLILFGLAIFAVPVQAGSLAQAAGPGPQDGQSAQGAQIFQTKCTACHTIGKGKLVGPDLKDVTQRRDAQWIKSFITDPNKMFSNDPTAQQLLKENNNVKMPTLGLSPAEVDALIAYLGGPSPISGGGTVTGTVAAGNALGGGQIFQGTLGLSGGGPACIACHTVGGTGTLGGGALGPDLTHVAQRYGQPGLAAALQTIAFPTMVGPFTNRPLSPTEQADLVAFFVQADQQQVAVPPITPGALTTNTWLVLAIASGGTAALFIVLSLFWPRQRQSISARLRSGGR